MKKRNMKNLYKLLLGAVAVCVLLVIADWTVGSWSEKMYCNSKYGIFHRQLYCLKESKEEILIMGSSRAAHHYVPQIFEDSLNMSCYNAGSDGMCIYYHYTLLASMIERGATPNIVLYEVLNTDAEVSGGATFTLDAALDRMAPHYGEFSAVTELFDLKDWKERIKLYSKTYRYNSKLVQTIKCNYIPWPENKGYEALIGKMNVKLTEQDLKNGKKVTVEKLPEIEEKKLEYVKKFITLCEDNNIKLIFIYSPSYNRKLPYGAKMIKEIASKNNVPFYNFVTDGKFNNSELFYDRTHLNEDGAKLYTKEIIGLLKKV